ncbi:MAG: hypothetical protein EXR69_14070 [Myxococcales bacterium]|nr:hypothetical protein [Myxococcales bacterium]
MYEDGIELDWFNQFPDPKNPNFVLWMLIREAQTRPAAQPFAATLLNLLHAVCGDPGVANSGWNRPSQFAGQRTSHDFAAMRLTPAGGYAAGDVCHVECLSSCGCPGCPPGSHCDAFMLNCTPDHCLPACGDGFHCDKGNCVDECGSNCPLGKVCFKGACIGFQKPPPPNPGGCPGGEPLDGAPCAKNLVCKYKPHKCPCFAQPLSDVATCAAGKWTVTDPCDKCGGYSDIGGG